MEVDNQLTIRSDCDENRMAWAQTQFFPEMATADGFFCDRELVATATARRQHRPLKDICHENIKWDPCMKHCPEKQQAQRHATVVKTRRQQKASVSLVGILVMIAGALVHWAIRPRDNCNCDQA